MRRDSRMALVMPYAAMSRRAYRNFRKGVVGRLGHVEFRLRFTRAWSFGAEEQPLFPVPSCVLFAERHWGATVGPLPARIEAFRGTLPRRDADETEARASLKSASKEWPSEASDEGGSPYRKRFRQGAILVPRRLTLVERVETGSLPPNPATPLVRGQTGNQDKDPWKDVDPPRGNVEKAFLRPALLGESIASFRVLPPRESVVPWDKGHGALLDAAGAARRWSPRLSATGQLRSTTSSIGAPWVSSGRNDLG